MIINNSEQIQKYLQDNFNKLESTKYKEDGFFYIDLIVRKKDDTENILVKKHGGSTFIKRWIINSLEKYQQYEPEMIYLADITGGRLYISINMKSQNKVSQEYMNSGFNMAQQLIRKNPISVKNIINKPLSIISSDSADIRDFTYWLFDIDTKNENELNSVINYLNDLDKKFYVLNTSQGYHVIADKINRDEDIYPSILYNDLIEIKNNALTLVYFNQKER